MSSSPRVRRFCLAATFVVAMLARGLAAHAEPSASGAMDSAESARPTGVAVMLGLGQWALGGGNIAVQGNVGRLALEYSHGQGVHLSELDLLRNQSEKDAGADVFETVTSGLGVGIKITARLRVLAELKANHYVIEGGDRNSRLAYTTFTIGPGVFYEIRLWKGLFIQPSLRWWPTVHSTMPDNAMLRRADGTEVRITSHASGVFPNINLGWEF